MSIQSVIETQKYNDYAVNHCQMDFGLIMRSRKDRKSLCLQVTNAIAPILLENGFLQKKSCFVRVHGDELLQIVGVQSSGLFGVYTYEYPLYDIFQDMLHPRSLAANLIGLKDDYMDEVRSLEAISGINDGLPLFTWQKLEQYDAAIEAEVEILRDHVLKKLDECRTGSDAIALNHDKRRPNGLLYDTLHSISMYLRDHRSVKEIAPIQELLSYMVHDEAWQDRLPQELYDAINNNDEAYISKKMKEATAATYQYLCGIFKSFSKAFPIPHGAQTVGDEANDQYSASYAMDTSGMEKAPSSGRKPEIAEADDQEDGRDEDMAKDETAAESGCMDFEIRMDADQWNDFVSTDLFEKALGDYNYDTGKWKPLTDRLYAFDAEVFDVGNMYKLFLQGVQSIAGDVRITDVREDLSGITGETDEEEEGGSDEPDGPPSDGTRSVTFKCNSNAYSITLRSYGDWFNLNAFIPFMNRVLEKENRTKRLWLISDGLDQTVAVAYGTDESVRKLIEYTESDEDNTSDNA